MYEHLLVPVDGSELSNKAMEHSIGLAKMLGASITGFTAEPPLPVLVVEQAAVAYDVATFQEHEKRCEAHARELAKKQGCDLIVMATHGRHGLDALIHGSLTKSVLAHSQVPLLILH
jgi:nucleotide-binding universal stress UspA family protein